MIGLLSFYARRIRRLLPAAFVVLAVHAGRPGARGPAGGLAGEPGPDPRRLGVPDQLAAGPRPRRLPRRRLLPHRWSSTTGHWRSRSSSTWSGRFSWCSRWCIGSRRLHVGRRAAPGHRARGDHGVSFAFAVVTHPGVRVLRDPVPRLGVRPGRTGRPGAGGAVGTRRRPAPRLGRSGPGARRLSGPERETSFPGWATLLPTIGCALVLASGTSTGRGSVAHASAAGPVAWLGDHSYAHLPVALAPDRRASLGPSRPARGRAQAGHPRRHAGVGLADQAVRRRPRALGSGVAGASMGVVRPGDRRSRSARPGHHGGVGRLRPRQRPRGRPSPRRRAGRQAVLRRGRPGGARAAGPVRPPISSVVDFAPADIPRVRAAMPAEPTCRTGADVVPVRGPHLAPRRPSRWSGTRTPGGSCRCSSSGPGDSTSGSCLPRGPTASGCITVPSPANSPEDPCLAWSAHVQARLLGGPRTCSWWSSPVTNDSDQFLTGQVTPDRRRPARRAAACWAACTCSRRSGYPTVVVKHPPGTRPDGRAGVRRTFAGGPRPMRDTSRRGRRGWTSSPPWPAGIRADELSCPSTATSAPIAVPCGDRRRGRLLGRAPHQRDIRAHAGPHRPQPAAGDAGQATPARRGS